MIGGFVVNPCHDLSSHRKSCLCRGRTLWIRKGLRRSASRFVKQQLLLLFYLILTGESLRIKHQRTGILPGHWRKPLAQSADRHISHDRMAHLRWCQAQPARVGFIMKLQISTEYLILCWDSPKDISSLLKTPHDLTWLLGPESRAFAGTSECVVQTAGSVSLDKWRFVCGSFKATPHLFDLAGRTLLRSLFETMVP